MKVLKTILISVLICMTLLGTASAVDIDTVGYVEDIETTEVQPRAEETKWYYKNVDGILYMRLWSITYGKWLTDWMPIV